MNFKEGDYVRIRYDSDILIGTIITIKENITLKLDSGYNVSLKKSKVKEVKIMKKNSKKEIKSEENYHINKNLKTILILHTGGTLASKVDYKMGGVSSNFSPKEIINMFPELNKIANIKSELVFNLLSEDISFENYKILTNKIKKSMDDVDGIIITHGTDTLGYTAAALSFIFENIPIPIILVGSQRSSDRGSTDSAMNLISATQFISKTNFTGVAICMHDSSSDLHCSILNPCKTRKMHTTRRDAFKNVNITPIAIIDNKNENISNTKYENRGKLIIKDKFEEKVGIIKTYPGIDAKQISQFSSYKGLIIEGTGLGHTPNRLIKEIKKLVNNGVVVVMTSQCIFGRVNMNVYSTGRELINAGVISGEDMLTETAYIKLSWLLGNFKKDQVKYMMNDNLRGEINNRITFEEDYLN